MELYAGSPNGEGVTGVIDGREDCVFEFRRESLKSLFPLNHTVFE